MMAILDHFRVFIHFDPCLCPSDSSGTLTAQKHVAYTVLAPRQATAWTPGIRVRDALAWQVGHCLLVWWTSLITAVSLDGRGQTCLCVILINFLYLAGWSHSWFFSLSVLLGVPCSSSNWTHLEGAVTCIDTNNLMDRQGFQDGRLSSFSLPTPKHGSRAKHLQQVMRADGMESTFLAHCTACCLEPPKIAGQIPLGCPDRRREAWQVLRFNTI